MTNLADHVLNVARTRPTEAEITQQRINAANTPTYKPVYGYGERVSLDRIISRDPDKDTDPIFGKFVVEEPDAYWVHIDGEPQAKPFTKRTMNGAPNWHINREATK